jgi:hypothetical protein
MAIAILAAKGAQVSAGAIKEANACSLPPFKFDHWRGVTLMTTDRAMENEH